MVRFGGDSYWLTRVGQGALLEVRRRGAEPKTFRVGPLWAEQTFEEAHAIDVPAMPPRGAIGVGGRTAEITLASGWNRSTFSWWRSVPEGWEPLKALAIRISMMGSRLMWFYERGSK